MNDSPPKIKGGGGGIEEDGEKRKSLFYLKITG